MRSSTILSGRMAIRCRRPFRQNPLRQVSQHNCFFACVTAGLAPVVTRSKAISGIMLTICYVWKICYDLPKMAGIVTLEKAFWALSVLLKTGLFALLLYRKNHRVYPYLFTYVLITLMQSAVLFATYRVWGFNSPTARNVAWGVQGLVIAARALAVAEICRRVLARYRGIWALAWRVLLATAVLVLVYAWAVP